MEGEEGEKANSAAIPSPQYTSRGKKLTSSVWNHMSRRADDDGSIKATCNYCKSEFTVEPSNGTTHLNRHVKSCAARKYLDLKSYYIAAGSVDNTGSTNQMSLRRPCVNLEDLRIAVSQYVVAGGHPFSVVEEPGFLNMMRIAVPEFKVISRYTIKRDSEEQYRTTKKSVFAELQNAPGRISFTTDNWRSENALAEFMCVTTHWIDKDWKLQKRIIKFSSLDPPFDGSSLADEIYMCLSEWKIVDKVFTFTLDNASYNDTMISSLRSHFLRKHSLVSGGEFFHMRCCCHIINLVVQAGLKVIDDVVVKVRKIVMSLRNSMSRRKKFYDIASTIGLDCKKRMRMDVVTRWNSTFTMLDRFLYFQDAVESFLCKDLDMRVHRLSLEEWEKVRVLRDFLHDFFDTTNDFSSSNTPTANVYFHGVWTIHTLLTKSLDHPNLVLAPMVNEMQAKFDKYWTDYNLLLSCAVVLDPRYKFNGVRYCYASLYGETFANEMICKIKEVLGDLLEEYKTVADEGSKVNGVVQMTSNDIAQNNDFDPSRPRAALLKHLNKKKKTAKSGYKSELEMYFDIDNDESEDILEFWKESARRLPTLAALARDILCIPISSVPSESSFSLGNKLIRGTRSSLSSSTVESLVLYEDWLRARGFVLGTSKVLKIGDESPEDIIDEDEPEKNMD